MKKLLGILLLSLFAISFISCDRFESDQEVPAFIKINAISLDRSSLDSSYLTSDIQNVWVTAINKSKMKEENIGLFKLPCSIPILLEGDVSVKLQPVIFRDLNPSSQAVYPFYDAINLNVPLKQGEETIINDSLLITRYNTTPVWFENFETPSISFTDSVIEKTDVYSRSGLFSGLVDFKYTDTVTFYSPIFNQNYEISGTSGLYLELDYWTEDIFLVGIQGTSTAGIETTIWNSSIIPAVKQSSSPNTPENWRKIYIYLHPTWSTYFNQLSEFRIVFRAQKRISNPNSIGVYIDNVKLIYSK